MKWAMVWVIVGSTVLADLLQSFEMKRHSVAVEDLRPGRLAGVLRGLAQRGPLVLAVFFMAISFFAFMKLLSVADLSFAVPVTAASVALETVLARLVLGENVTALRWAGRTLRSLRSGAAGDVSWLHVAIFVVASAAALYQLLAIVAVLSHRRQPARAPICTVCPFPS